VDSGYNNYGAGADGVAGAVFRDTASDLKLLTKKQ